MYKDTHLYTGEKHSRGWEEQSWGYGERGKRVDRGSPTWPHCLLKWWKPPGRSRVYIYTCAHTTPCPNHIPTTSSSSVYTEREYAVWRSTITANRNLFLTCISYFVIWSGIFNEISLWASLLNRLSQKIKTKNKTYGLLLLVRPKKVYWRGLTLNAFIISSHVSLRRSHIVTCLSANLNRKAQAIQ